jgi:hypothetical protein
MQRIVLFLSVATVALFTWASADRALGQPWDVPQDGMFHIESTPVLGFTATLTEDWVSPHVGNGTLHVFAPVLPELPGQAKVFTRLSVVGNERLKSKSVVETSSYRRRMLRLDVPADKQSPRSGVHLKLEYEGILLARTLTRGKPPRAVPELTAEERRRYLMTSLTMDHDNAGFVRWMNDQGLKRQPGEQALAFAHRVFTHFIDNAKYGGDTSNYEARRPSRVCKSFANDCGGLSLLFVAVMRTNKVPARTLFGRWVLPQTDHDGQYHVVAEFFVDGSGWVPVDVAGTLVHKPQNRYALFGNTDGQHLAFHIDTDLEPAKGYRHAWAQYLLLQWFGVGEFGKDHRLESKWDVVRRPIGK